VFPLAIVRAHSVTHAWCSLIARRDSPDVTVLYFASAAQLFAPMNGDAAISSVTIERVEGGIAISPDNVILPTGLAVDISLLRAVVASERAQPLAVSFDPLPPGASLTIVPASVSDRLSPVAGCVGAAAIAGGRSFGVVTGCPLGAPPIVSPYAAARIFLDRHIPQTFAIRSTSPRTLR